MLPIFLPATVQPAPTLGEVRSLLPERAGDLALAGHEHGPVAAVRSAPELGSGLPSVATLLLTERPRAVPAGCIRVRWTASFSGGLGAGGGPNAVDDRARLDTLRSGTEVALPDRRGCDRASYAVLNSGIGAEEALAALRTLARIETGDAAVSFDCRSTIEASLCASPGKTRAGLAAVRPWVVMRRDGLAELWLGTPGGVVTTVRFDTDSPHVVSVRREAPAPF